MKEESITPLTLVHAIKNKFTYIDVIKYFKPTWTDGECDHYLWEHTCYPFSLDHLIDELNKRFITNPIKL